MSETKANTDQQQNSPTAQLGAITDAPANSIAFRVRREVKPVLIERLLKLADEPSTTDSNRLRALQLVARIVGLDKAGSPSRKRTKRSRAGEESANFQPPSDRIDALTGAVQ